MQVLWSRAAQTRSCHCRSCLTAATTVARRTTTTLGRRGLKVGDLFTACYSTILATAAVADAGFKESRRKEWDRLIAEVKGASNGDRSFEPNQNTTNPGSEEAEGSQQNEAKSSSTGMNSTSHNWSGMSLVSPHDPYSKRTSFASQLDTQLKQSHATSTRVESSNTESVIHEEIFQDWLDTDDPHCTLPERDYKRDIHLGKAAQMIASLVSRLLTTSETPLRLSTRDHAGSSTQVMLDRFAKLHSEDPQRPEYFYRTQVEVQQDRNKLHRSLITIFVNFEKSKSPVELAIGKICYNLLICTASPNITTYNILLRGFTLLEKYDLGDLVIASFFDESKFKPNPATARIMLEHYSLKRDRIGFQKIVQRIRGVDGDMKVSRRLLFLLDRPDVREWIVGRKLVRRDLYLVEKFPRNDRVFDSLIKGYLCLNVPTPAAMMARAASQKGQQINPATFAWMASKYVRLEQVDNAWSLLTTLLRQFETDVASMALDYCSKVRRAVFQLLALCGIDFYSYLNLEGPIRNLGCFPLDTSHRELLRRMINHLRIRILEDCIEDASALIKDLRHVLGPLSGRPSLGLQTWVQTKVCADSNLVTESTSRLQKVEGAGRLIQEKNILRQKWAGKDQKTEHKVYTLLLISKMTYRIDKIVRLKIRARSTITSIYYRRLPPHLQQKYDMLVERHGLSQKLEYLSWVYVHWLHEKFLWEGGLLANTRIGTHSGGCLEWQKQPTKVDLLNCKPPTRSWKPDPSLSSPLLPSDSEAEVNAVDHLAPELQQYTTESYIRRCPAISYKPTQSSNSEAEVDAVDPLAPELQQYTTGSYIRRCPEISYKPSRSWKPDPSLLLPLLPSNSEAGVDAMDPIAPELHQYATGSHIRRRPEIPYLRLGRQLEYANNKSVRNSSAPSRLRGLRIRRRPEISYTNIYQQPERKGLIAAV